MELIIIPLGHEGIRGYRLLNLPGFLTLQAIRPLGLGNKGFIAIYSLCVQPGDISLENDREGCICRKGEILDRESNVHWPAK